MPGMAPDQPPSPTPPPRVSPQPWAGAAMWTAIVLILATAVVLIFRSCLTLPERALEKTGETISKAGQALASVAAAFRQGTIRTSFVSYATTITNSQRLQFATLKQMEIFTR